MTLDLPEFVAPTKYTFGLCFKWCKRVLVLSKMVKILARPVIFLAETKHMFMASS